MCTQARSTLFGIDMFTFIICALALISFHNQWYLMFSIVEGSSCMQCICFICFLSTEYQPYFNSALALVSKYNFLKTGDPLRLFTPKCFGDCDIGLEWCRHFGRKLLQELSFWAFAATASHFLLVKSSQIYILACLKTTEDDQSAVQYENR